MKTISQALLGVAITATMLSVGFHTATAGDNIQAGCNHFQCPSCNHTCHVTVEPGVKERHCWNVECKPICIPSIRFPWQSCCDAPKCGKVIMVKKLRIHEYECPVCKCKWNVNQICQPCGCGHCDACAQQPGGCAAETEYVVPQHAPQAAPQQQAAPAPPKVTFFQSITGLR